MKRNHTIQLYNVLFPVWFLMYLYPSWLPLAVLAFNFAFDSLVLALAARWQKLPEIRRLWKQTILRVWLLGFAADILGALLNLAVYLGAVALGDLGGVWAQALYGFWNPLTSPARPSLPFPARRWPACSSTGSTGALPSAELACRCRRFGGCVWRWPSRPRPIPC